jgi:hypothetical protein
MDQRSIILYLHLNGLSAHVIHDGLAPTLGSEGLAYSTVARYLHEAKPGIAEVTLDRASSSPRPHDSNWAI